MKRLAVLSVALLAAGMSQATEIYNNGPVVDGAGRSVLAAGAITLGYGANTGTGLAVADDFNVEAGQRWNVTGLDFFSYQTGATGFTLREATWSIVGDSPNSSTILFSGTTSLSNGGLQGYRVTSSTLSDTQRGIYRAQADVEDFSLDQGHYFLRWSLSGTAASGPWVPPVSDGRTGNAARMSNGAEFLKLIEGGSGKTVELPFALQGSVSAVPEPETYGMLLAGLAMLGVAARRRKQA